MWERACGRYLLISLAPLCHGILFHCQLKLVGLSSHAPCVVLEDKEFSGCGCIETEVLVAVNLCHDGSAILQCYLEWRCYGFCGVCASKGGTCQEA